MQAHFLQRFQSSSSTQRFNLILAIALIIVFSIYYMVSGSNTVEMRIEDGVLILSGLEEQSYEISLDDISAVSCGESADYGTLQDGVQTDDYCYGTWQSDSWGTYQLYITTKVDAYVLVETQEGESYVFNFESNDSTQAFCQALQELLSGESSTQAG